MKYRKDLGRTTEAVKHQCIQSDICEQLSCRNRILITIQNEHLEQTVYLHPVGHRIFQIHFQSQRGLQQGQLISKLTLLVHNPTAVYLCLHLYQLLYLFENNATVASIETMYNLFEYKHNQKIRDMT